MSKESPSKNSIGEDRFYPLAAWFLGPRAENADVWKELFDYILSDYIHWRKNYFPSDPIIVNRIDRRSEYHELWLDNLISKLDSILNKLKNHFPFHSPRYIAHMLSEQSLPSILGYFAGMLYNPNNVTREAAPITVELELQVGRMVAEMLGFNPNRSWTHICSGGTLANLEALWVARSVQLLPFIVREYCVSQKIKYPIKTANLNENFIDEIDDRTLISLRPNESLFMLRQLAAFIHERSKRPTAEIISEINDHISRSEFNVARVGYFKIIKALNLSPVIFVSSAAHYSIHKAANILGYGENNVRLIPINPFFQADINELQKMIDALKEDEYIASVIGIVGTTEEGAVDPIHKLHWLRKKYEMQSNRSFWLHIDAAWGGYIRSLFSGLDIKEVKRQRDSDEEILNLICDEYVKALGIHEKIYIDVGKGGQKAEKSMDIRWASKEIYLSFIAMSDADSITVDPHKMGYVPYPAGIVSFRNGLVTELIQQRAQYISDEMGGIKEIDQLAPIDTVGPFILEGSKPGAAAISCWLAHSTIPLKAYAHGKIIKTSLLNTKKLFKYLVNHRYIFNKIHESVTGNPQTMHPFTFVPFFEPDTNIICFLIRPMMFNDKSVLMENQTNLIYINKLNEKIYEKASIASEQLNENSPIAQPFYISRTKFEAQQYSYREMAPVFHRMKISCSKDEYNENGIFVLRLTVMNPWYFRAEQSGKNYLFCFLEFLHKIASREIEVLYEEMKNA